MQNISWNTMRHGNILSLTNLQRNLPTLMKALDKILLWVICQRTLLIIV